MNIRQARFWANWKLWQFAAGRQKMDDEQEEEEEDDKEHINKLNDHHRQR